MAELALLGGQPVAGGDASFPVWPQIEDSDRSLLLETFDSRGWGIGGRYTEDFAKAFCEFQGVKYGATCCNGTLAIEIALEAAGLEAGDEVIMPAYTFMATATAVLGLKGVPVFADIEPGAWNLDPRSVEAAISDRTRFILPVHIGGRPANMSALKSLAGARGLKLIEDAAQAHGAAWEGTAAGAWGDLGTFSFQSSKNLTCGEGGFVASQDEELYYRALSYLNCGRVPAGAWYQHDNYGQNLRLSQLQAAVLLGQLSRLPEQFATRQANWELLMKLLAEAPGISLEKDDPRVTRHAHHLFILRLDPGHFEGLTKAQVAKALVAEGVPFTPGYSTPVYRELWMLRYAEDKAVAALARPEALDYEAYFLPEVEAACAWNIWTFQKMLLGTAAQMQGIADAVTKVAENVEALRRHFA
jgi:dTDP-4-amino-4,6-dideoxygalactose transaminase